LVLVGQPLLSAAQVPLIQKTADKDCPCSPTPPVNATGSFNEKASALWFGHGKVNAFKGVRAAAAAAQEERSLDQARTSRWRFRSSRRAGVRPHRHSARRAP